ncbi:hypothetical protein BCV70DRAFT_204561 [Testicularia cyperi]|uniref:Secreted protein n=1 Tax=Testicularia cyperi TaxID=1882483 RepID=A0A317Y169_9BASI|nr:hypothetical protein BCV70DRAFT_204561 [Testicularia cyperi]
MSLLPMSLELLAVCLCTVIGFQVLSTGYPSPTSSSSCPSCLLLELRRRSLTPTPSPSLPPVPDCPTHTPRSFSTFQPVQRALIAFRHAAFRSLIVNSSLLRQRFSTKPSPSSCPVLAGARHAPSGQSAAHAKTEFVPHSARLTGEVPATDWVKHCMAKVEFQTRQSDWPSARVWPC